MDADGTARHGNSHWTQTSYLLPPALAPPRIWRHPRSIPGPPPETRETCGLRVQLSAYCHPPPPDIGEAPTSKDNLDKREARQPRTRAMPTRGRECTTGHMRQPLPSATRWPQASPGNRTTLCTFYHSFYRIYCQLQSSAWNKGGHLIRSFNL